MLTIATIAVTMVATPSDAQVGCCYCDNCPPAVGPFCTDLMSSSESCVDFCITQRGCGVLEFSPQETCAQGCGSKPPFFSPTPTSTATLTVTQTPTISPTPSTSPTQTPTQTPVYCCQGDSGNNRCGISNPSNEPMCLANETPVLNAACLAGQCRTFTPTFTQTLTRTPTHTRTETPTKTPTNTPTSTPTIFMGNLLSCDRIKSSKKSAMDGMTVIVEDPFGQREKVILKPRYLCNPSVFDGETIERPEVFQVCYKTKEKIAREDHTVRNEFDAVLPVNFIKGELLCLPSYLIPTATPKPAATATATRTATP
jgi:hypothetical protein